MWTGSHYNILCTTITIEKASNHLLNNGKLVLLSLECGSTNKEKEGITSMRRMCNLKGILQYWTARCEAEDLWIGQIGETLVPALFLDAICDSPSGLQQKGAVE